MKIFKVLIAQVVLAAILATAVFGDELVQDSVESATFSLLSEAPAATPSIYEINSTMEQYFSSKGCTNTSNAGIDTYWDMMVLKSMDMGPDTGSNYAAMNFETMPIQDLAVTAITMISEGIDPADYQAGGMDLIAYISSCMGSDGGFSNPKAKNDYAATYKQVYPLMLLGIADVPVDQKAADWFASYQDSKGIFGYEWGGVFYQDYDTTSWALIACGLAGISYPKETEAEDMILIELQNMDNSNTYACMLDYMIYSGYAVEEDLDRMCDKFYDASKKRFTYNGNPNGYATQQCAMALAEYINGSVYQKLDTAYEYTGSALVSVRLLDQIDADTVNEYVPRVRLSVAADSASVLTGWTDDPTKVEVMDIMAEAVLYHKLGHDPSREEVSNNAKYINANLSGETTYNGVKRFFEHTDGSYGYYIDRDQACRSAQDEVPSGSDFVFFHYDWNVCDYAYFDQKDYSCDSTDTLEIEVTKAGWYSSETIPATVIARKDGQEKSFTANGNGPVELKGLSGGTWKLTAAYKHTENNTEKYIVQPYAELVVTQRNVSDDNPTGNKSNTKKTKTTGSSSGSGSSAAVLKPEKTGTWNDPVTDGTWYQNENESWSYKTNAIFSNTWGYINNPFAKTKEKNGWFFFDKDGKMLTGWQLIDLKWYYLNPSSENGTKGTCLLNATTSDGYTVDANGAWCINGVVQILTPEQAKAYTSYSTSAVSGSLTASGTASSGSTSSSGTESTDTNKKQSGYVNVSITANANKTDGGKVSFSASGKYSMEDMEGASAYDVLAALCSDKGWSVEGSSSYVSAINGLAEFDCGATSGWMYSINGKYPNVSAGEYTVKKNDKIVWKYVTSMQATTDDF